MNFFASKWSFICNKSRETEEVIISWLLLSVTCVPVLFYVYSEPVIGSASVPRTGATLSWAPMSTSSSWSWTRPTSPPSGSSRHTDPSMSRKTLPRERSSPRSKQGLSSPQKQKQQSLKMSHCGQGCFIETDSILGSELWNSEKGESGIWCSHDICFWFELLGFCDWIGIKISLSDGGGEYFGPYLSRILFQSCTAIVCLEFILILEFI